ncbi:helix-turn-helix domain-containing protein [Psychromonas sp. PT13]|uniref:helix-turn-helix domain-containing protein n=1 Tax=Psychromonas sp. PT13 TaxID=3439547 RepID=UPI003EC0483D
MITKVYAMELGSCTRKLVLLALAFKADRNDVCSVSYDELAVACCINKRTAMRNVKQLEKAGFITKFKPGGNYTNVYQLTLSKGDISLLEANV